VVDDRPENNTFERGAFEAIGVNFSIALSTEQALNLVRNNTFSAIISDMGRREGREEGYKLLETLRSQGSNTPFFIYAGSNLPEHKRMAAERGAQGSTNDPQELIQMVMKVILKG
jgi:CheY-like chemotaxis protein